MRNPGELDWGQVGEAPPAVVPRTCKNRFPRDAAASSRCKCKCKCWDDARYFARNPVELARAVVQLLFPKTRGQQSLEEQDATGEVAMFRCMSGFCENWCLLLSVLPLSIAIAYLVMTTFMGSVPAERVKTLAMLPRGLAEYDAQKRHMLSNLKCVPLEMTEFTKDRLREGPAVTDLLKELCRLANLSRPAVVLPIYLSEHLNRCVMAVAHGPKQCDVMVNPHRSESLTLRHGGTFTSIESSPFCKGTEAKVSRPLHVRIDHETLHGTSGAMFDGIGAALALHGLDQLGGVCSCDRE